MMGEYESARTACERADSAETRQCLAIVYGKLGRRADAEKILAKLQAQEGDDNAHDFAEIHAQLGRHAEALDWLEKALRLRDPGLTYLKVDPLMDPLRSEPRFQTVMRELKFPD